VNVLVFNPGSNSLKAGVVSCKPEAQSASEALKAIEVIVEGIGKEPKLGVYRGKKIVDSEPIPADDFSQAAESILSWLDRRAEITGLNWRLKDTDCIGVRVVHGGSRFAATTLITPEVEKEIEALAKWAPLHNRRSVEILPSLRHGASKTPIYAAFDTAFHTTIPPKASLYAIPFDLSRKHGIYRYGFHGLSHRYLMERYAAIVKRRPQELNLVTMHLESGCSVTAISKGRSVDNTMGLTPLEGLMMGARSGDIDPALPGFLAKYEKLDLEEVMEILEKRSGLLGVSGVSLDTRVLMRRYDSDERVRIAMEMFSYRVLKAVGAYLASLGGADAVIFGGGIAENTPLVRQRICDCLRWCGLEMDLKQNHELIDVEGRLSTPNSKIQAYVIPAEEILQIAHECCQAGSAAPAHMQPA
jgi:acetate kinase